MNGQNMKMMLLVALYLSFSVQTNLAKAEEQVIKLCPALSEEKTYENNEDFKWIAAGKDGWIFRTDYDLKQEEFEFSEWSLTSFKRLRNAFQKNGTELAVPMIPTRGIVGYPYLMSPFAEKYDYAKAKAGYAGMIDALKSVGIIVADTKDVDTLEGFFLKRDNHWTALGSKYMAMKMAEAIKVSPVYASLTKKEFVTTSKPVEDQDANDNFLEFIEEKCGVMPPVEKIPAIYTTTPKEAGDVGAALLDEKSVVPEVVLLGTSNSTEPEPSYANFVGFLREYLGVDVKNDSVQGGSMRGAIGNYVLMGDYKKEKPKLLIWELSAHYGFDQKALFRELIPAVYGECGDDEALAKTTGKVNPNETQIFDNLEDKGMFSYSYYLYLELDDKDERNLVVDFVHMGDKKDTMEFERSVRNYPVNNGVYFAELRFGINEPLKSININTKNGAGGFKAKICKVPA